jgi:hypothetical protein
VGIVTSFDKRWEKKKQDKKRLRAARASSLEREMGPLPPRLVDRRPKGRHGRRREALLLVALADGLVSRCVRRKLDGRRGRGSGLFVMQRVDGGAGARARRGAARRARRYGSLIDVLAVDVDGVGDKRGPPPAVARVPLLEPKKLELGLDALNDGQHGGQESCEGGEERKVCGCVGGEVARRTGPSLFWPFVPNAASSGLGPFLACG